MAQRSAAGRARVAGLRELQKALKETSDEAPKAIQNAHKQVAAIVVRKARQNVSGTTLADRILVSGTTRGAAIRFKGHKPKGQSKSTDAFVQEFGGRAPLFGDRDHWHDVKPKNKRGYFIYPAIRETQDKVNDRYLKALDAAIARHWAERPR